jgi:hypothetical protein
MKISREQEQKDDNTCIRHFEKIIKYMIRTPNPNEKNL